MTPETVTALLLGAAGLLTAIGKILVDRDSRASQSARLAASAERAKADLHATADAAALKLRADAESWMRSKLSELLDDAVSKLSECEERSREQSEVHAREIAELRREIETLRAERPHITSEDVRELIRAVGKLDPYRTPTESEFQNIRNALKRAGIDDDLRITEHAE